MQDSSFEFIDRQEGLESFCEENAQVEWLTFDTEFVGEKRYYTRLCLIQIGSSNGNFLIDTLNVKDLQPLMQLIRDPKILKITHAGENDYRILYEQYDTLPQNVFDIQIAAAFLGFKYPVSFRKIVSSFLGVSLGKSHTIANWEKRPLQEKELKYALDDILYLYPIYQKQKSALEKKNRLHWVQEEFRVLEQEDFYFKDPNTEALKSNLMRSLNTRERIFLLRLYKWRDQQAASKDYSKDMVLPSKYMGMIVKAMRSGTDALFQNRRIPPKLAKRLAGTLQRLYEQDASSEERQIIQQLPSEKEEDVQQELLFELLYTVIKVKCTAEEVAPNLVLPRGTLKQIKKEPGIADEVFNNGWRAELFGPLFTNWLKEFRKIDIDIEQESITIRKES